MLSDTKVENLKSFTTSELREEIKRRKCQIRKCRDCIFFEGKRLIYPDGHKEDRWICIKQRDQGPQDPNRKCQCLRYKYRGQGIKAELVEELVN